MDGRRSERDGRGGCAGATERAERSSALGGRTDEQTTERNGYRARCNRLANVAASHYRARRRHDSFHGGLCYYNNNITPIWVEAFVGSFLIPRRKVQRLAMFVLRAITYYYDV